MQTYGAVDYCVTQVAAVQQMSEVWRPVEVACRVCEAWGHQGELEVAVVVVFPSPASHMSLSTPAHSSGCVD